jgi:hypothetical protein
MVANFGCVTQIFPLYSIHQNRSEFQHGSSKAAAMFSYALQKVQHLSFKVKPRRGRASERTEN